MGFVMNFIKCNNFSFIIQIEDDSFVQDSGVSEDVISSKKRKVISDIDDDDSVQKKLFLSLLNQSK